MTNLINAMWAEIAALTEAQSEAIVKNIATQFTAAFKVASGGLPLTDLEKATIKAVTKTNLGAIATYNNALGKQMEKEIQRRIAEGGGYDEISTSLKKYVTETFGDSGSVTIDNTGLKRTVIEVGKDGKLRKVIKEITQPYSNNTESYSQMLARTIAHQAQVAGRRAGYISKGVTKWRYLSASDERVRPWHMALAGRVFAIDSEEESYALDTMGEPNCRCRQIPYFGDPDYDTPDEVYERRKEAAGLYYDDDNGEWAFKE